MISPTQFKLTQSLDFAASLQPQPRGIELILETKWGIELTLQDLKTQLKNPGGDTQRLFHGS